MPPGGADEAGTPKGRMTAYAFFVQICREEHKKQHPEEHVEFQEFSRKCASRWKTMTDREKLWFNQMADEDKKRFEFANQAAVPKKKRVKRVKDPNAPKRALSGFFWFSNEERSKVVAANPDFKVGDIAKELGRRWGECDQATRAKYESLAAQDRQRYEKEKHAYSMQQRAAENSLQYVE